MYIEGFDTCLRRSGAPAGKLVDWLQGYKIPGGGPQPDLLPSQVIVGRLQEVPKEKGKRDQYALNLARKLARILSSRIDRLVIQDGEIDPVIRWATVQHTQFTVAGDNFHPSEETVKVTWPRPLFTNTLFLTASLRHLDESDNSWPGRVAVLSDPVAKLWKDMSSSEKPSDYMLRASVRSAVIATQKDDRLLGFWQQIMNGEPDPLLGGDKFTPLEGIMHIPAGGLKNPGPFVDAIIEGFRLLQPKLSDRNDLLRKAASLWPNYPNLRTKILSKLEPDPGPHSLQTQPDLV